jgi:ketosteroid isomerase-like protein
LASASLEVFDHLAVLVAVERQHGEVGELPSQEWSLRITLVFRRGAGVWRLAHRHADPLTRRSTRSSSPPSREARTP